MAGIYYSKAADGCEVGRWNGKSIRKGSIVTKDNQIYLGKVIDKDKVPSVIGKDEEGEDVEGYIYLCRDMQAFHSKSDHFMSRHGKEKGDAEEIIRECEKFGLFAIVGTEDLRKEGIIPVYYQRQGIEQFFDSAKNLGKMMPVRNRTLETIQGHMLMSFIAAFLVNVIKNRMNILDIPYVSVPSGLCQGGGVVVIDGETENPEYILEQEPESFASRPSPEMLFAALNFVGADVFENAKHGDNEIVPAVPYKDANVFFRSFGIPCPEAVLIQEGHKLCPVFKPTDKNTCNKKKIFAKRPFATSEELKDKLKKKKGEKEDGKEEKPGEKQPEEGTQDPKPKQGPGRKKGSKNKKTLAREAEMAARGEAPIKRGRGRPLGAKDKKPRKRRAAK